MMFITLHKVDNRPDCYNGIDARVSRITVNSDSIDYMSNCVVGGAFRFGIIHFKDEDIAVIESQDDIARLIEALNK